MDDLLNRIDAGFARIDADIRDLRGEVRTLGAELRGEMQSQGAELRGEMQSQGAELRGEMQSQGAEFRRDLTSLRITLIRVGGGVMAVLVGVIAAVLVGG